MSVLATAEFSQFMDVFLEKNNITSEELANYSITSEDMIKEYEVYLSTESITLGNMRKHKEYTDFIDVKLEEVPENCVDNYLDSYTDEELLQEFKEFLRGY